eukprot:4729513-Amphidinium_carterae.1
MHIEPDSRKRLGFDLCSVLVLLFDVTFTPYHLAWDTVVPETLAMTVLLMSSCFWMVDMVLNFLTGFYTSDGLVDTQLPHIALRYFKGWFVIDFTCIAGDVVSLFNLFILQQPSGEAGVVARTARLFKLT